MYHRPTLEGPDGPQVANLSASGSLWKDALILRDDVSHSMWSQLEGRALKGPAAGTRLATYPFERTTWGAWKAKHPNTLVLEKEAESRQPQSVYASYFSDPQAFGVLGTGNPDERLPGKELVLGVRGTHDRVAVPLRALERDGAGAVAFQLDGEQAICVYDREHDAARCFRAAGATPLVYGEDPSPVIARGDARWDLEGRPLAGGDGTPLEAVDATPVFWFAWAEAYPMSRIERP